MAQILQVRIFSPHRGIYALERWAETLIGRIIAPVIREFEPSLEWYWFTRYVLPRDRSGGDCDIAAIPEDYGDPRQHLYQSIRFRYAISDEGRNDFEGRCRALINEEGCTTSGFLDYPIVSDLGNDEHLEEPRTIDRQERRAQLVVANYYSVARLILDALSGPEPDGSFRLPYRQDLDLERRTPFHKIHHIFCNATGIPLYFTTDFPVLDPETNEQAAREFTWRLNF